MSFSEKDAKELFDKLDANGDHVLALSDLKKSLKGICNDESQMKDFLKACDEDGDGKVSWEEFKALLGLK